jgi:hypothetical protein
MSTKLTKKFEIVNYTFGIFKDIALDDFICQVLEKEPDYELFQVIEGTYWHPGGTENYRQLLLKRK